MHIIYYLGDLPDIVIPHTCHYVRKGSKTPQQATQVLKCKRIRVSVDPACAPIPGVGIVEYEHPFDITIDSVHALLAQGDPAVGGMRIVFDYGPVTLAGIQYDLVGLEKVKLDNGHDCALLLTGDHPALDAPPATEYFLRAKTLEDIKSSGPVEVTKLTETMIEIDEKTHIKFKFGMIHFGGPDEPDLPENP